MSQRIAVIGAGGFVGSRMIEIGLCRGLDVVPIVRSPSSAARLARFGIDCRFANANVRGDLVDTLRDCDVVVNLTAGDSLRIVQQVINIHQACEILSIPTLIHMSSAVVLGDGTTVPACDQPASRRGQSSLYSRAKAQAEIFLATKMDRQPAVVTLRPGLIWGPRSPWVVGPLVALTNDSAFLVAGGSGICNLIYLDNLIESILAVTRNGAPKSGFFNVSDDRVITWRAYYSALARMLGIDIERVRDFGDVAFEPTFTSRLQRLKETWCFDTLKRKLRRPQKEKLKRLLQLVQSKLSRPDESAQSAPSKELWDLQRTFRRLPNDHFISHFGRCNTVDLEEALRRTETWARYAGFLP